MDGGFDATSTTARVASPSSFSPASVGGWRAASASTRTRSPSWPSASTSRLSASAHPPSSHVLHGSTSCTHPSCESSALPAADSRRVTSRPLTSTAPNCVPPPWRRSTSWPEARRSGSGGSSDTLGSCARGPAAATAPAPACGGMTMTASTAREMRSAYSLYKEITMALSPAPVKVAATMRSTTVSTRVSARMGSSRGGASPSTIFLGGSASSALRTLALSRTTSSSATASSNTHHPRSSYLRSLY